MQLLTYKTPTGLALGVKTPDGVLDVSAAQAALGPADLAITPDAVIAGGTAAVSRVADLVKRGTGRPELFRRESELALGPCVPAPGKLICVGLNYRRHAHESGMKVPDSPVLFSKFNNALAAPGAAIPLPSVSREVDYEAELAVVIGRLAKDVKPEEALDYVLGYCNANDVSARDLQMRTSQWLLGKSLDKFLPLGPYLVTAEEVGDPQQLTIRLWLNGELRQNSNTADMVFDVPYLVSYISRHMTLEPGDVIATGTPEGVILGMKEKVWLKPGDEMVVEVAKLGRLTNTITR